MNESNQKGGITVAQQATHLSKSLHCSENNQLTQLSHIVPDVFASKIG